MTTKENFKLVMSALWNQVASLFFLLLVISASVSFFVGEYTDGTIILTIILINSGLGFFQEFKASKASEKLLHLIETKVYVLRAGVLVQVSTGELVEGDIIHLVPGSIVPADLVVTENENALMDDSVRTGETMPKEVTVGENLYAGSLIVDGKLSGRVIALGENSSIVKYEGKLEKVSKWSTFGVFTEKVIKYVFIISLASLIVAMYFLVFVMGKYDLASFFIFAIAMLVGVVPEVLPLIITIILTRESLALSKEKVIVKRLSALEGLGSVQFLLTDKTGTITENKLKVSAVHDVENFWQVANSITEGSYERSPMDTAYDEAMNGALEKTKTTLEKIKSFEPFEHSLGYESFVLEDGVQIARGQISKILELCKKSSIKPQEFFSGIFKDVEVYENKGMRVIALAVKKENNWNFVGYVSFADPIKNTVSESLKIAHESGISVKILTGDSEEVAHCVAEDLGLIHNEDNIISLENKKISDLSDKQLLHIIVFARCTPENKLELIERYLKIGSVAFLGDGINDALSLKRADIGIAVDNASDIAKESADLILLEKDISLILKSVGTGRKALRNILVYIIYTLSGNAGTFFSLLIAAFFYRSLPMLPIQILLNNLLTDIPLMLIFTDNVDEYALKHVPHFEPSKLMKRVFIFGIISSVFDLIYFQMFKHVPIDQFQTGWFLLSVFAELMLVLSIRSSRSLFKSPPISMPLGIGIAVCGLLPFFFIYNLGLATIFKFASLSFNTVATIIGIIIVYVISNETAKYFMRQKQLYNKPTVPAQIFK